MQKTVHNNFLSHTTSLPFPYEVNIEAKHNCEKKSQIKA